MATRTCSKITAV